MPPPDPLPPPTPRVPASNTTPLKSAARDLVTSPTPATSARALTQYTVAQRAVTRAALRENPPPLPPQPSHGPQPLGPPTQAQLPTPVNPTKLAEILHGYEWHTAEYLVNGFSEGFSIGFKSPQRQIISPNLRSAIQNPSIVEEKISKELELGRLAGPFSSPPFPDMVVSPIGIVPKKEAGKYR